MAEFGVGRAVMLAAMTLLVVVIVASVSLTAVVGHRLSLFSHRWPDAPYPAIVRLEALAPRLRTGDLILFAAAAPSITNLVFSLEYFTHAGLVIQLGNTGDDAGDDTGRSEVELGESRLDQLVMAESYLGGTRLVPLRARLEQYPGAVYVSRRAAPLEPAAEAALLRAALVIATYPTHGELAAGALGFGPAASLRHVAAGVAGAARAGVTGAARAAARTLHLSARAPPRSQPPSPSPHPAHCMFWVASMLHAAGVAPPSLTGAGYISMATAIAELPQKNSGDYTPFVRVLP
jgi:hypothetical protein